MVTAMQTVQGSNKTVWAGYDISPLPVLFLVFDAVIKTMKIVPVVESFALLSYPIMVAIGS